MTLGVAKDVHSELKFKIFQQETVCLQIQAKIPGFVEWKWCKAGCFGGIFLWKLCSCHRNQTNLKNAILWGLSLPISVTSCLLQRNDKMVHSWWDTQLLKSCPESVRAVATYAKPKAASLWAGGGHLDLAVFLSGGSHQHFGQRNALSYWTVPHHGAFTIHNYIPPNASHSYCCEKPDTPQAFPNTH